VADVWERLPLRDRSIEVVLSVFAPRNLAEFSRVLQPDGRLIAVTPRADHLAELRSQHDLLDVPAGKAEQLAGAAAEFFDLVDTRVVKYHVSATAGLASDLIAMGPNAFHTLPTAVAGGSVGIDVTIQSFRPLSG
jgi:23S rRNA (guanine745-N1)-methyltransferase